MLLLVQVSLLVACIAVLLTIAYLAIKILFEALI